MLSSMRRSNLGPCWLRLAAGILLAFLAFAVLPEFISIPVFRWSDQSGSYPGSHPSSWTNGVKYDLERLQNDVLFAIASLASDIWQLVAAFAMFWLVTRQRHRAHGETLCRRCGYILRGLTLPRCPECGERI